MLIVAAVVVLLLLSGIISAWRDPRRLRPGVYLGAALVLVALLVIFLVMRTAGNPLTGAVIVLALSFSGLAVIAALGAFLIVNGANLARHEGVHLPTLLSTGLGVVLLGYAVAVAAGMVIGQVYVGDSNTIVVILLAVGLPAGYLGFVFATFLGWSLVYARWGRRRAGRDAVGAVIVLGAGLLDGDRVSPLLAGRLDRGQVVYELARRKGRRPIVICSGGRGPDERIPEAEAMARYLVERGIDESDVVLENSSTDTAENLTYSARLLAEREIRGPVAVVTSDYHAFRAATLMRNAGIDGFSTGAHTPSYFFPNAQTREYLAILRDHLWLNVGVVVCLSVPWMTALIRSL
ncbi:YdcF family protein [Gordonia sp. OPL2]|uniref:YdcF family protein n=1 Tax=Gordonia sp. OPL2 TaxID=2486274 RepID=UPI001654E366|nr:YdcF family protein [Gordonia sp. OPL2]ROZ89473.1 YdcF family protein [Gordonia sp. OPL2]